MLRSLSSKKVQILTIVILTFLAYSNIFPNGLMSDDQDFIVDWKAKQSLANWRQILEGAGPEERGSVVYRPVRGVVYMVYHRLFGTNTVGYHLNGILVHLGVTTLVYLITFMLIRSYSLSIRSNSYQSRISTNEKQILTNERMFSLLPFLTGLLFGLHPVHTEAITFMTSSMDMIGVLFMFGSFYGWVKSRGSKGSWGSKGLYYWGSVGLAGLAFFTYELTLTLPFMLVLADYALMRRRISADMVVRLAPYFVAAVIFVVLRAKFVDNPFANAIFEDGKFNWLVLLTPKIIIKYLELLILPLNLSINHYFAPGIDTFQTVLYSFAKHIRQESFFDWQLNGSVIILFGVGVVIWRLRKIKLLIFALLWFLLSLLPVLNILPQPTLAAERYLYVPSFGFVLIISYLSYLVYLRFLSWRGLVLVILIGIVAGYGVRTYLRNFDWRDEIRLWEAARQVYPQSPLAHYNLANLNAAKKNFEVAASYYSKTIEILPFFYNARFNLATVYRETGRKSEAQDQYKKVIETDPTVLEAYLSLSDLYYQQGENDLALSTLEWALKYQKKYLEAADKKMLGVISSIYGNIGVLYQLAGDKKQAIANYKTSLQIDPNNEFAQKGLGQIEGKKDFQSITLGGGGRYDSKSGFSFEYPDGFKVIETREKVRLESELFALEIYADANSDGLSLEEYTQSLSKFPGLLKYGFIEVAGQKAYARLFNEDQVTKSDFFVAKSGKIFRIVISPSSNEAEKVFDKIVESLNAN
ncbi:tetratricopeptide repeat protein [Candidatus Curtissbacteria bacterium]|nr:tetratricopeptide repeat protein [Candidatus Curtissbacteria bacterium]